VYHAHADGHHGTWYDLTVTVAGDATFVRQFAGRVETGQPSISDPAIGSPLRP
jgi:phospholipase C